MNAKETLNAKLDEALAYIAAIKENTVITQKQLDAITGLIDQARHMTGCVDEKAVHEEVAKTVPPAKDKTTNTHSAGRY